MFTMDNEAVRIARDFRQRLMHDPSRPTYHLVNSEGDNERNYSTDPNFMIYWKGQYHFGYMCKGDRARFWSLHEYRPCSLAAARGLCLGQRWLWYGRYDYH